MKALFLLPCACLLVSCGGRQPLPPSPPVTAPTVPTLSDIPLPSTGVASPLAREASRAVDRVQRENETLRDRVEDSVDANRRLQNALADAIVAGSATREDLVSIQSMAEVERNINGALQVTVRNQSSIITDLQEKSFTLETEILSLGEAIAVANQRLTDTTDQLDVANQRIAGMTDAHNTAVKNAGEWKELSDTAEGRIAAEVRWKWRFFWWGTGASVAILGYLALRLHPATRLVIP